MHLLDSFICDADTDQCTGVFSKWNRNSLNSGNLINHCMTWAQFKDPISHVCPAGAVVASWSLTQEVAGWQVQALLL